MNLSIDMTWAVGGRNNRKVYLELINFGPISEEMMNAVTVVGLIGWTT